MAWGLLTPLRGKDHHDRACRTQPALRSRAATAAASFRGRQRQRVELPEHDAAGADLGAAAGGYEWRLRDSIERWRRRGIVTNANPNSAAGTVADAIAISASDANPDANTVATADTLAAAGIGADAGETGQCQRQDRIERRQWQAERRRRSQRCRLGRHGCRKCGRRNRHPAAGAADAADPGDHAGWRENPDAAVTGWRRRCADTGGCGGIGAGRRGQRGGTDRRCGQRRHRRDLGPRFRGRATSRPDTSGSGAGRCGTRRRRQ